MNRLFLQVKLENRRESRKATPFKIVYFKPSKSCCARLSILLLFLFGVLDYFVGIQIKLQEKDYFDTFKYPIFGNISIYIDELQKGLKPSVTPYMNHNYTFFISNSHTCDKTKEPNKLQLQEDQNKSSKLELAILVKSAVSNVEQRNVIRKTWGDEKQLKRLVTIHTVFLLGYPGDENAQNKLLEENSKFHDLVQGDFTDTYFNNTIKTLMGFQWASIFCEKSNYYLFVDDDYYISVKNLIYFLQNPSKYEEYAEKMNTKYEIPNKAPQASLEVLEHIPKIKSKDFYAGYVCNVPPVRDRSSKFFMGLEEYEYNLFPPFINAGAYVVSQKTMKTFFLASHFVKMFRFDDVYIGLLAKKCDIKPYHSKRFWRFREDRSIEDLNYTIASHEFHNPNELQDIWLQQKKYGNA